MQSKDTDEEKENEEDKGMRAYEVKVEYTDQILGRNREEALEAYYDWLNRYTTDWKIKSIRWIGKVWPTNYGQQLSKNGH